MHPDTKMRARRERARGGDAVKRGGWIPRRTPLRRRNKFGAIPVTNLETGEHFDSQGEARWVGMLKVRQLAGEISGLDVHPQVELIARRGKAPAIRWRLDASYVEDGRRVFGDYKPRPFTGRETLLLKLWLHYGPGPLRIVGKGDSTLRMVFPEPPA